MPDAALVTWIRKTVSNTPAAALIANPDLSVLDDMPPLYEISPKSLPHLEALGLVHR